MRTDFKISHYDYELPDSSIAKEPLEERDSSRLLVVNVPTREVSDMRFLQLPELIPSGSLLLINASRVITARLPCKKKSGGQAEVLLLAPISPSSDPAVTLSTRGVTQWSALIGGKRIQAPDVLHSAEGIQIRVLSKNGAEAIIELRLPASFETCAEAIEKIGRLPLPPYLKREDTAADRLRYQTVYADRLGSVAAPTAGLHFTPTILDELQSQAVKIEKLHLHVGAGTFKPVEAENARDHEMHAERIEVHRRTIERIIACALERERGGTPRLIAVGTTSLRTLESLAIAAGRVTQGGALIEDGFLARQWEGRDLPPVPDSELFQALLEAMKKESLETLTGFTSLMIAPDYPQLHADRLITNFHQPRSTLLLLVAAFSRTETAGPPLWRQAYEEALRLGYRFLSYGDSSLWIRC